MYRINIQEEEFLLNFTVKAQDFIFLLNSSPAATKIAAL